MFLICFIDIFLIYESNLFHSGYPAILNKLGLLVEISQNMFPVAGDEMPTIPNGVPGLHLSLVLSATIQPVLPSHPFRITLMNTHTVVKIQARKVAFKNQHELLSVDSVTTQSIEFHLSGDPVAKITSMTAGRGPARRNTKRRDLAFGHRVFSRGSVASFSGFSSVASSVFF